MELRRSTRLQKAQILVSGFKADFPKVITATAKPVQEHFHEKIVTATAVKVDNKSGKVSDSRKRKASSKELHCGKVRKKSRQKELNLLKSGHAQRSKRIFERNVRLFTNYFKKNKKLPPSDYTVCIKDKKKKFSLGMWCYRIRKRKKDGLLSAEQENALNKAKFNFGGSQDALWRYHYEALKIYKARHKGEEPVGRYHIEEKNK